MVAPITDSPRRSFSLTEFLNSSLVVLDFFAGIKVNAVNGGESTDQGTQPSLACVGPF
jgi:hypothetical protein